jgi:hypothetical protein
MLNLVAHKVTARLLKVEIIKSRERAQARRTSGKKERFLLLKIALLIIIIISSTVIKCGPNRIGPMITDKFIYRVFTDEWCSFKS